MCVLKWEYVVSKITYDKSDQERWRAREQQCCTCKGNMWIPFVCEHEHGSGNQVYQKPWISFRSWEKIKVCFFFNWALFKSSRLGLPMNKTGVWGALCVGLSKSKFPIFSVYNATVWQVWERRVCKFNEAVQFLSTTRCIFVCMFYVLALEIPLAVESDFELHTMVQYFTALSDTAPAIYWMIVQVYGNRRQAKWPGKLLRCNPFLWQCQTTHHRSHLTSACQFPGGHIQTHSD